MTVTHEIQRFWCPIPERIHPDWRAMDSNTISWMKSFRLEESLSPGARGRLSRVGAGELAGRTSIGANDAVAAQFGSDSLMWLFAFDDAYCDRGLYRNDPANMALLAADMIRVAETGETLSSDPCVLALADLRRRLDSIAEPSAIARWVSAMRGYLTYQVWEAAHRHANTVPSVNDYVVARIRSGSMELCAMALEITGSYHVPSHHMDRHDIRALTEMACCIVGLDNDIISYSKEHVAGDTDQINLVDAFACEKACPTDQAFAYAMQLRDAILACYLSTAALVADAAPAAEVVRYVDGLSSWVRANLDWGLGSARYANSERPATISENPQAWHDDITPPPGVAWWWRLPAV